MHNLQEKQVRTLDLAEFAHIAADETVIVEPIRDRTRELFDKTLDLFDLQSSDNHATDGAIDVSSRFTNRYIPLHDDLRKIYLFAEALGGYEHLNELLNEHSPANLLSARIDKLLDDDYLKSEDVRVLEEQHANLTTALENANEYLKKHAIEDFTREELTELHHLLVNASRRSKQIVNLLGKHKIREIEQAVEKLYAFHEKIHSVEKTVTGIFMVDSEVLFIPTRDLIECVNTIFSGVGNPYLADNIDGVLLLAARNLLIEAVTFYSYYGKERIYNLVSKGSKTVSNAVITHHIRSEISELFKACKTDNKLVLKRIMKDAEKEFEISVEAIQAEAEHNAVAIVRDMLPRPEVPKRVVKKSLFNKIMSWFRK